MSRRMCIARPHMDPQQKRGCGGGGIIGPWKGRVEEAGKGVPVVVSPVRE